MGQVTVLDPTASVAANDGSSGPSLDMLPGRKLGFRRDMYWLSWGWVCDEWASMAEQAGATTDAWEHHPPTGTSTGAMLAELDGFFGRIDAVVVGMANCGSCTMWTIHDALRSLERGVPTVVAATSHFVQLSRALAKRGGRADIRIVELPFPLEGRSEQEVREIARGLFPAVLDQLTGTEVKP